MKKFITLGVILLLLIPILTYADNFTIKKPILNETISENNTIKPELIPEETKPNEEPTIASIKPPIDEKPNNTLFPINTFLTANITKPLEIIEYQQILGIKRYAYANNKLVAEQRGNETTYYHQDRLSNRLVTDQLGNVIRTSKYFPFGQEITNEINPGFAQKELDESSLHYFGARYFDSNLGRFISVDPYNGIDNNLPYAYSSNNPLKYYDPDGEKIQVIGKELNSYPIKKYLTEASKFVEYSKGGGVLNSYNFEIQEILLDSEKIYIYRTNKHKPFQLSNPMDQRKIMANTDSETAFVTFNFKEHNFDKAEFFHTLMHEVAHQLDLITNKEGTSSRRSSTKGAAIDELMVSARVFKYFKLDGEYKDNKEVWKELGFSEADFLKLRDISKKSIDHYTTRARQEGVSKDLINYLRNNY
jgi:RHS repeat-associated protein